MRCGVFADVGQSGLDTKLSSVTTIALFGATGKTGRLVLDKALASGASVRVLVRDPAKLTASSDRLNVIQGDVLDPPRVMETVAGSDVVISVFGQVKGSPRTLQTDGTRNIAAAMTSAGVRRIISLSGGGLRSTDTPDQPSSQIG